jgi:hypothetical protein
MTSTFANELADVAIEQHAKFETFQEDDPKLCTQIRRYWEETGHAFESCTAVPWSGVFISWCVKTAGATSNEFRFSSRHAIFVHDAINNPRAFAGLDIADHAPQIGDIIQNNRSGTRFDFEFARRHDNYPSHSAIVMELGNDTGGRYALTIGGNEGDAIRRTRVRLRDDGLIQQKDSNPYICILKNLK